MLLGSRRLLKVPHAMVITNSSKAIPCAGFTLTELVLIILLTSILAVVAFPRFFDTNTFASRSFFDQAIELVRYSQKIAIAQGRTVFLNADSGSGKICATYVSDPTCASAAGVLSPVDRSSKLSLTVPSSVTLSSSVSISFSALGSPSSGSATIISVIGDGMTRTITIEPETGYVH